MFNDLLVKLRIHRAHSYTSWNRAALERSRSCGCVYCLRVFSPADIELWTDRDRTAVCPNCSVDSVVPSYWAGKSRFGVTLDRDFLESVRHRFFDPEFAVTLDELNKKRDAWWGIPWEIRRLYGRLGLAWRKTRDRLTKRMM